MPHCYALSLCLVAIVNCTHLHHVVHYQHMPCLVSMPCCYTLLLCLVTMSCCYTLSLCLVAIVNCTHVHHMSTISTCHALLLLLTVPMHTMLYTTQKSFHVLLLTVPVVGSAVASFKDLVTVAQHIHKPNSRYFGGGSGAASWIW